MTEANEVPREEGSDELPQELRDLLIKGWKPRIKKKGGREYIALRGTSQDSTGADYKTERTFGLFDPQKWELITKFLDSDELHAIPVPPKEPTTRILASGIGRHKLIPATLHFDTDILEFYEYCQSKGYNGTLEEWLHECLRNYFVQNGVRRAIIINPIEVDQKIE